MIESLPVTRNLRQPTSLLDPNCRRHSKAPVMYETRSQYTSKPIVTTLYTCNLNDYRSFISYHPESPSGKYHSRKLHNMKYFSLPLAIPKCKSHDISYQSSKHATKKIKDNLHMRNDAGPPGKNVMYNLQEPP